MSLLTDLATNTNVTAGENTNLVVIIDPNTTKMRNARNIKAVSYYLPDPRNPEAESKPVDCVRYTIVGKRHTWDNFAPRNIFCAFNPSVEISE